MPMSSGGFFGVPLRGRGRGGASGFERFPLSPGFLRPFELLG